MNEMAEAHARDSADERRLRDMKHAIDTFLSDPPSRLAETTRLRLQGAAEGLWDDILRIQRVWD